MKNLITLLTCLFILSPNLVLSETINELVERGGLQYMKFSDVPFTGKTMGKTQATFRDGKEHGPWVTYYDNGQLLSKVYCKDGKREGPWVSFKKYGTVFETFTGTFKNGVKVK